MLNEVMSDRVVHLTVTDQQLPVDNMGFHAVNSLRNGAGGHELIIIVS